MPRSLQARATAASTCRCWHASCWSARSRPPEGAPPLSQPSWLSTSQRSLFVHWSAVFLRSQIRLYFNLFAASCVVHRHVRLLTAPPWLSLSKSAACPYQFFQGPGPGLCSVIDGHTELLSRATQDPVASTQQCLPRGSDVALGCWYCGHRFVLLCHLTWMSEPMVLLVEISVSEWCCLSFVMVLLVGKSDG